MASPQMSENIALHYARERNLSMLQQQIISNTNAHNARAMRNQNYSAEELNAYKTHSNALVISSTTTVFPSQTPNFTSTSFEAIHHNIKTFWGLRNPVVFEAKIRDVRRIKTTDKVNFNLQCDPERNEIKMQLTDKIARIILPSQKGLKDLEIAQEDILLLLSPKIISEECPIMTTIDKASGNALMLQGHPNPFRQFTLYESNRVVIELAENILNIKSISS